MPIQIFKDRIVSLEKQLYEELKIIEKFMEGSIFETLKKQDRDIDFYSLMTTGITLGAGTVVQDNCPSNETTEQKNPKPQGKKVDDMKEQNSNRISKEQSDQTKTSTRKKVVIIGDSLLNGLV